MSILQVSLNDFKFNKANTGFFEGHVWSQYTASQRSLADPARQMVADLAMNQDLQLDYATVYLSEGACPIKELFTLKVRNAESALVPVLSMEMERGRPSPAFRPMISLPMYPSLDTVRDELEKFEQACPGVYNSGEIDTERNVDVRYITNKVRHLLSAVHGKAKGIAQQRERYLGVYLECYQPRDDFYIHLTLAYN